ncbi:hypothetical protein C1645_751096 [Glomus cerebriforme]|uniref:Uncharacterized protein n=1 Tax=Glomus cerebriforme TaxID=658196 RepID=A0A397TI31_9GLOM|nr:hypothetical protein C1645_751096 [Glomus cerebriforme]
MAEPTHMDFDPHSGNNQSNQTVALKDIKATFDKFFSDPNYLKYSPDEISTNLCSLLEGINKADNNNQSKQEMKEVNNNIQRNLPGDATTIPLIPPIPSTQNSQIVDPDTHMESVESEHETEKQSKNKKEKTDKESKESKELKELKEKEKELKAELKKLNKERDQLKESYTKEIKTLNKKIEDNDKEWTQQFNSINNIANQLNNDKLRLEQGINAWRERHDHLDEQLKNKRKEYSELYKKNEELRNEASLYQSALGDAKNYRLGDNDANNPTQLTKEIEIIQDKINEFCKIKGGVELNEQNLTSLFSGKFKCKYEGDKVLTKAALQHLIIDTILERTNDYIRKGSQQSNENNDNKIKNKYLELDLLNSTNAYLFRLMTLIKCRDGTDEVSFAAPKKIRQLVYAVLGDRGFGLNSDKKEHEFVQELKEEIIVLMNNYRTIKKVDKKKENEDMIADIIRSVIKMFIFRINVLEPPGEVKWISKDTKVDPTIMEVGNLEDDNYDDWIVNLCSFPLIAVNLKSETDRKVLVPAKIMAIKVEHKSSVGAKVRNFWKPETKNPGKPQQPEVNEPGKPVKKNSMDSQSQNNYPYF